MVLKEIVCDEVDGIDIVQYRIRWWVLQDTVMNLQIP
jgi:hypothetical protein